MARTTSRHRCTPSRPCYTNRKVAAIFQQYYSGGGGQPPGPVYEPEYQAALNAGFGTPPATDAGKLAESNKIKTAKALGLWDAAVRFYIMDSVSADPDWKSINYKDVGNTSTYILRVNSPTTGAKKGWTGNGSTAYLDFQFVPSTQGGTLFTLNDAGVVAFVVEPDLISSDTVLGAQTSGRIFLSPGSAAGNCTGSINGNSQLIQSVANAQGLYILRRIANNEVRLSKNGGADNVISNSSNFLPVITVYGLGNNDNGTLINPSQRTLNEAIFVKASEITPADVNTWYNNWIIERDA